MIGRLRGTMVERNPDGACVVDVGGVGYEVLVPPGALGGFPEPPEVLTLHVHTHVREESLALYGFASMADRDAFRTVLGVGGVGPKMALSILSALPAPMLAQALAAGDRAVFTGIPGVGKKTSERLLLELTDKIGAIAACQGSASVPGGALMTTVSAPSGPLITVANALAQLGYKQAQAERAVSALGAAEGRDVETLLKLALAHLG